MKHNAKQGLYIQYIWSSEQQDYGEDDFQFTHKLLEYKSAEGAQDIDSYFHFNGHPNSSTTKFKLYSEDWGIIRDVNQSHHSVENKVDF